VTEAEPPTFPSEDERVVEENGGITAALDVNDETTECVVEDTRVRLNSLILCSSPSRDVPPPSSEPDPPYSPPRSVASVPSSPRVEMLLLDIGDTNAAADCVSNCSGMMEGYTSESSAAAACCGDEDLYDVVGGGRSDETRFVESQEKICKFFDDFEEHLESSTLQGPDVTSHHHHHIHHHQQQQQQQKQQHSPIDVTSLEASGGEGNSVVEVAGTLCPELIWDGLHDNNLYNGFYCPGQLNV